MYVPLGAGEGELRTKEKFYVYVHSHLNFIQVSDPPLKDECIEVDTFKIDWKSVSQVLMQQ